MSDIVYNSAATGSSEKIDVRGGSMPMTIVGSNIDATDTVVLQISQDEGATYVGVGIGGAAVGLGPDSDSNVLVINQPGLFRMAITNVSTNTIKITTDRPSRR